MNMTETRQENRNMSLKPSFLTVKVYDTFLIYGYSQLKHKLILHRTIAFNLKSKQKSML